ncbi:MAG: hypothetical protein ACJ74J_02490 [Blastocatellia bacterium]
MGSSPTSRPYYITDLQPHKHTFENVGGGCLLNFPDPKLMCDDHYRCSCGAEFRLKTSLEGHTYLPKFIQGDEPDEIKKEELQAINKMLEEQGSSVGENT